ncbi:MAG: protein jag [Clostridia bacterium]|nr:protein jag [Clostridia bacterium]
MATIEKEAKTVEEAISLGLMQLGLPENEVEIEVVQKGGLFKNAIVRLSTKYTMSDRIYDYISGILEHMGLECSVDIGETEEGYEVELGGADSALVIGYRGEVLDALQYLVLIEINKDHDDFIRVVVDAEGYRAKRVKTLGDLATRLAEKALRTGQAVELEPMNIYERKTVHEALSNNTLIETFSTGNDPNRFITIQPKQKDKNFGANNNFRKNGLKTRSFGAKKY